MQIVIDIPEEYKKMLDNGDADGRIRKSILNAVANGTVLPKHGRLIDVNEYFNGYYNDAREFLDKATTILEATGVEE